MDSIGIVIPTYHEEASICQLIEEIRNNLPECVVVVVDDSSNLKTVEAVDNLFIERCHIVHRDSKNGRGSAVLVGLRFLLSKDCRHFVELDADFSHSPSEISLILKHARDTNADLVVASRYLPKSHIENWPFSRRIFSRFANWAAKKVLRVPVVDYTNGYRYYSRRAVELIASSCSESRGGFIMLSEILVMVYYSGFHVTEVPTHFVNRKRGESSVTLGEIFLSVKGLIEIYFLKRGIINQKL